MRELDFGPSIRGGGSVVFRLWAPLQDVVRLDVKARDCVEMARREDGWHECEVADVLPGSRYSFILSDGLAVPDPASRFQPHDVHEASEVVDLTSYRWTADDWHGRPWEEIVLYELHIGTFTEEGTFLAAIDRLDHLRELGITAIQIMPVSDFPGRWGWGYDGVLPYAPDSSYGRPEELQKLVDEAHRRGLAVILDVVYNHFGPDGNYQAEYAPLFTDHHQTPWGNGINYDGEKSRPIREFVIQNAIYWITRFRLDGLRLDAVHAIQDDSDGHILAELARRVRSAVVERHVHLIVENENNDSDLLVRDSDGRASIFTAQWNDDIHHVLHSAATGEAFGYYADYAGDPQKIGRALAEGFVYQGEFMPFHGEPRGKSASGLPPTAFISFIQNHDQIGNRAGGDRKIASLPDDVLKAIAAIYLLAPQVPMLFMGEEWRAGEPFPYFCDFNDDLNEKVTVGRRNELSRLPGFDTEDLPHPTAESTFRSAKIDWSMLSAPSSISWLSFYKRLLKARQEHVIPRLRRISKSGTFRTLSDDALSVEWRVSDSEKLKLLCNLNDKSVFLGDVGQEPTFFSTGSLTSGVLTPWSVLWSIGQ
ncbi:malto-oligosyltrehalose trehalohydrolase [Rhizobium grahamii]|uniref:Malto-oligosyltrehalose trehalohydrolase n=1 Tax=Rhizobium grahamii TaxID=1120045 RepID=A0A370KGY8_9HYPH|nr:malto-oligosyltrehalose trehalohydrolase [Rhizobium grahamii]RDJ04029.1 malto-oligosyltrehalose trehalohydrolase [Rhizobium grahamii]